MSLDLKDCLAAINPAGCSYKEWCDVGMALKHEEYSVADWEAWSARDSARYHPGECVKKWETFRQETGEIVTGGTLVTMARIMAIIVIMDRAMNQIGQETTVCVI